MNIMVNVGLDPSKSVVITQGCDSIDIADADLLIIINGKESNGDEFLKLESIRSISVLINETAVEAYGDKGKNGVIVVETHSNATAELDKQAAELDKQAAEWDRQAAELDERAAELDKRAAELDKQAAELDKQAAEWDRRAAELDKQAAEFDKTLGTGSQIIINGKKSNPVVLSQLNPDDIESIGSVGRSGKNNVFTIGTKDNVIIPESDETSDTKCLFIIDGKEASKDDLSKLETNVIKSLNILKSKTAIKEYGDKGKNGVIIVKTK
jgi:prefoldin subunit 5